MAAAPPADDAAVIMYPRTAHVLASPDNLRVLTDGVVAIMRAEGAAVTPAQASHAVAEQVRLAIERNIMGARYLTHASMLSAANEYIVMHAVRDLHAASAVTAEAPSSAAAPDGSAATAILTTTRRREVAASRRGGDSAAAEHASRLAALMPQLQSAQEAQQSRRTPRSLLRQ